jgi:hypothetical protein
LFALWHRDKHRAGLKVQEPSVIGDWRRRLKRLLCPSLAGAFLTGATATIAGPVAVAEKPAMSWTNGAWANSNFFPIAVWLQDPALAGRHRQAGINTYADLTDKHSPLSAVADGGESRGEVAPLLKPREVHFNSHAQSIRSCGRKIKL